MIVQRRDGALRLIRQHDHALLSGELALAWRSAASQPAVSEVLVLATSLHDLSWRRIDAEPRWNPLTRRPHDFLDFPRDAKFRSASRGITRVSRLHPYAAMLVSLHYATFAGAPNWFTVRERERRDRILGHLGDLAPDPERTALDLGLLRLFDVLSLHACQTSFDAVSQDGPEWLSGSYSGPAGGSILVAWTDADTLAMTPFPFGPGELNLRLSFRELKGESFADAKELRKSWWRSARRQRNLRVVPGGTSEASPT